MDSDDYQWHHSVAIGATETLYLQMSEWIGEATDQGWHFFKKSSYKESHAGDECCSAASLRGNETDV